MKRPRSKRPGPPRPVSRHTTVTAVPSHTTVPKPPRRRPKAPRHASRIARIIGEEDATLVDLLDNLLSKGVVLNADLVLALADVDLVYLRLSALLCAADRILPRVRGRQ
jgi:hypothetical protein